MTRKRQTALYTALALLLAAIPTTLMAHGPDFHEGRGPGLPGGHGRVHELIADRLELSEGQREELRAVHESYRPEIDELTGSMEAARRDLRERIHAEVFDEAAIREAADRVASVSSDLAVLRARMHGDLRQILTPEQLEKAQLVHGLLGDVVMEWRGRRGHGPLHGLPAPEEN